MSNKNWTKEEDARLLRTRDEDLAAAFPDHKIETLRRRKRLVKNRAGNSSEDSVVTNGLERLSFDTNNFNALVVGDLQSPFINHRALEAFNSVLSDVQPDVLIDVGDHYDNYAISRFVKDPRRGTIEAWQEEAAVGTQVFKEWRNIMGERDIILLKGNHEKRWDDYVIVNTKAAVLEMAGESLSFEEVYGLNDLDIVTFPYMQPVRFGDVVITHGTRGNTGNPGALALNEIRKRFGTSVIVGHCHTGAYTTQRFTHGVKFGIENGMLADANQLDYTMFPNWVNGFTYLEVKDGIGSAVFVGISSDFSFNGVRYVV